MRVSNPTFARKWGSNGRFHILAAIDSFARFMECGMIVNKGSAIEVRFDFEPAAVREQVCGLCIMREQAS